MKKRIVLASLLKTVDDPRMYYKFARSISQQDKYDINIVGFPTKSMVNDPAVTFHPLPSFTRKSFSRWAARIHAARVIWKLKPQLLIISTHELLGIALVCRFFRSANVIYDVRENYAANLRHGRGLIGSLAALMVRTMEYISSPFIDHFILAEKCYYHELPFARPATVLENRALRPPNPLKTNVGFSSPPNRFVFTGTLARQTGVHEAIKVIDAYRKQVPEASLHIVGNSFDKTFLKDLIAIVNSRSWINAEIDEQPLPYTLILDAIASAEVGIISYEELPFLLKKNPTKLFEYMGNHLPVLFLNNNTWYRDAHEVAGAALWNSNCTLLLQEFERSAFYPTPVPKETYWDSQINSLFELINTYL